MRVKTLTLAAAAATLALAPIAVQAAPSARASAPVASEMEMGGGSDSLIAILAAAVLATFVYFSIEDGDDDPISA